MTSDYTRMIATLAQVQAAMLTAASMALSRCLTVGIGDAGAVMRAAGRAVATPAETRQAGVEDALVLLLRQHQHMLRGLAGASDLAALAFLNDLDQRRGPRPVDSAAPPPGA